MIKLMGLLSSLLLLVACSVEPSTSDLPVPTTTDQIFLAANNPPEQAQYGTGGRTLSASSCIYPAGWRVYTIAEEDTLDLLAWRHNISAEALLQSNCLSVSSGLTIGMTLYVPEMRQAVAVQTILPLGISQFSVEPMSVTPGEPVTLTWASQGPVANVRLGLIANGQYYEQANGLLPTGTLTLNAPIDGHDSLTYLLIVGDGSHEISAQSTIRAICPETWFFSPSPLGCPSAPLVTTFIEQHFERGTFIYVPALGLHYVMVTGQEAHPIENAYHAGTPVLSPEFPAGYFAVENFFAALWQTPDIQASLGYAVSPAKTYSGLWQRGQNGVIYFSASSGHIYRLGEGLVWGVIIPE